MATRCIWPPDIWLGFLWSWSPRPTFSSTSTARWRRSFLDTPARVRAISTLASTVWWGMRLVALKDKADGVVAVRVPIAVVVLLCGAAVDNEVAGGVAVQAADDVQQGGLTRAGGAQDGDEFAVAQVQADIIQRGLYKVTGFVFLADLFQL